MPNKIFTLKRDSRNIPTDSWSNVFHIAEYPLTDTQKTDISNIFNSLTIKGDFLESFQNTETYIIQQKDTWESISVRVYGTSDLWWLIMVVNNVKDPFSELIINKRIRIPKPNVVDEILFRMEKERLSN